MKKLLFAVTTFSIFAAQTTQAGPMVRVKALGSSPRGQYVAFEEFGYQDGKRIPYSKIRVRNMWKNRYEGKPVSVFGSKKSDQLNIVRDKAKGLAANKLKKFNIET